MCARWRFCNDYAANAYFSRAPGPGVTCAQYFLTIRFLFLGRVHTAAAVAAAADTGDDQVVGEPRRTLPSESRARKCTARYHFYTVGHASVEFQQGVGYYLFFYFDLVSPFSTTARTRVYPARLVDRIRIENFLRMTTLPPISRSLKLFYWWRWFFLD